MDLYEYINSILHIFFAAFGEESTVWVRIVSIVAVATAATGAAAYLVKFLEWLTKITPTDKDDKALAKVKRGLAWVIALLDYIAANPPRKKDK